MGPSRTLRLLKRSLSWTKGTHIGLLSSGSFHSPPPKKCYTCIRNTWDPFDIQPFPSTCRPGPRRFFPLSLPAVTTSPQQAIARSWDPELSFTGGGGISHAEHYSDANRIGWTHWLDWTRGIGRHVGGALPRRLCCPSACQSPTPSPPSSPFGHSGFARSSPSPSAESGQKLRQEFPSPSVVLSK